MSSAVDRLKLANEAHPPPANDANDFTLDLRASNESAAKSENAKVGAAAGTSSNAKPRHPFVSIDSSISLGLTGDSAYVTKQLPPELKQQLSIEVRSQTTAYVCSGMQCSLPLRSVSELRAALGDYDPETARAACP